MDHVREIAKIAEWGVKGDSARVRAYLSQLIEKLTQAGDEKSAERLKEVLADSPSVIQKSGLGVHSRLPVDGESRLSLADEETVDASNFPIVLDKETKRRVEEFIEFVGKAEELEAHGVGMAPSLITFGPPGTGKTQLARFIAGRLKLPIITARADTLISSFLGSTSKNFRSLFDHVAGRPCVLFLDEIDAFAKQRDDHQELGELKRVVVSLLQNIDAMNSHTVFLAATNHEHLLDPAIWRRFTFRIPLSLPSKEQRAELMRLFLGTFGGNVDGETFAILSETLSGSDIRTIVQDSIRDAVVRKMDSIDERRMMFRTLAARLKGDIEQSNASGDTLNKVRCLAPDYFTGKKLALMFGMNESTVSRRMKKHGGES